MIVYIAAAVIGALWYVRHSQLNPAPPVAKDSLSMAQRALQGVVSNNAGVPATPEPPRPSAAVLAQRGTVPSSIYYMEPNNSPPPNIVGEGFYNGGDPSMYTLLGGAITPPNLNGEAIFGNDPSLFPLIIPSPPLVAGDPAFTVPQLPAPLASTGASSIVMMLPAQEPLTPLDHLIDKL